MSGSNIYKMVDAQLLLFGVLPDLGKILTL